MYGKWVIVNLGDNVECRVWINCIPTTPDGELQRMALGILKSRMPEKKKGIMALGESLNAISDFEYSQGYGSRFELEKQLKEQMRQ